jgi:hypothetical protein
LRARQYSPDHTLDATWAASALGTTVGRIELWRTGLAVLALWAWWLARRPALALLFAAAALAVSGASGHSAAMQPAIAIPAKAIHLLASAVCSADSCGSLFVQPATACRCSRRTPTVCHRARCWPVLAVAATGVIQTLLFLPSITDVADIAIRLVRAGQDRGAAHARGVRRVQSTAGDAEDGGRRGAGGATLRTSVTRELFVMALVIILGGLLAYVPPPGEADEGPMSTHQSTS